MVLAKKDLFTADLQTSAELFKVLGHPARLAILDYLSETKSCIIGDIADVLPLSRTTVNQHLKELKDAGLIEGTITGVKTCYCLNFDKLNELIAMSAKVFGKLTSAESQCCK
jgi:predicted transcriptional regulator